MIPLLMIATVLVLLWLTLLSMTSQNDWVAAATAKVVNNQTTIQSLYKKAALNKEYISQYSGLSLTVMKMFVSSDYEKTIAKIIVHNQRLQSGDLRGLNLFIMPGYVLQRKFVAIGRNGVYRNIVTHNIELYGKKYAEEMSKDLLAALLSYPIIGLSIPLGVCGVLFGVGNINAGLVVLAFGFILVLVGVYAMYDDVSDKAKKRRELIARQFPNVVSKLALLVTSGMIMNAAWQLTADSQEGELYLEMRKTSDELSNLVSPEIAFGGFINRCNTKETSKLASAILQNLSKGNMEIGRLLRNLAKESWQERRHLAKRDSEKANAKLMVPTMLLFIAILVMIVVPIFISMNIGF